MPTDSHTAAYDSDAAHRATFEAAPGGIAVLDRSLKFIGVNPAFIAITGCPRVELIGADLRSLVVPEDQDACAQIGKSVQSKGFWEGILSLSLGVGRTAEVEWRFAADPANSTLIALANDVSDRRRAEKERESLLTGERAARQEAERLNRVKDEFLATLSHELRNPLSAILGWVSVLQRGSGVPPEFQKGLAVIERNARLQTHLIADLLDYAGMRFGKMNLDIVPVCPAEALQATQTVVAPLAAAKRITLDWDVGDKNARVMGDDGRLQQIVWNLVSNAIKFTPADGRVAVRARVNEENYEISVADTGRGINPEFLPHLFDRFSQQDSGLNKSFSGLGIGLTIVKHLVEIHAGTIEAFSLGEGQGARFTVQIPLTQAQPRVHPTDSAALLDGYKVLVVEDDDDTRDFVSRVLQEAGAEVTEVSNGDEALAEIKNNPPSVLVSDIGMSRQDGYQLIRSVREAGYTADKLPAIALTAFSRAQDRADAIKAGYQMHLIKPISSDRLTTAIATLGQQAGRHVNGEA